MTDGDDSIRGEYERHGSAEAFYRAAGENYRNPHEEIVRDLLLDALGLRPPGEKVRSVRTEFAFPAGRPLLSEREPGRFSAVLDLAAGSGEVTMALRAAGIECAAACDPFTAAAYEGRTGKACEPWSFEDIAAGALAGRDFSLVICSFALHLVAPSRLAGVCDALSRVTPELMVLTPHKKPDLREALGWRMVEERIDRRVRARRYERVER